MRDLHPQTYTSQKKMISDQNWPPIKWWFLAPKIVIQLGCGKLKNRMSNYEGLSFFRHAWEKSVYKNLFLVAKRDLSWKMQWYCSATFTIAFFAVKLIFCKDKFMYTMTSFPLSWDDYDLTRLHCNKGLEAILLIKKAQVESYQQYLWGLLFPSPRIVQNEQLDIILLTQKSLGDCFLVLGWKNLYVDLNVHPQHNININFL